MTSVFCAESAAWGPSVIGFRQIRRSSLLMHWRIGEVSPADLLNPQPPTLRLQDPEKVSAHQRRVFGDIEIWLRSQPGYAAAFDRAMEYLAKRKDAKGRDIAHRVAT